MAVDTQRFGFGRNWEQFIEKHFSPERVEISRRHLLDFLQLGNLEGKYFLDIGCGSGLHSLAALRAGAARIVSFDYDPASVSTTTRLKQHAGNPAHWEVLQGSVLDLEFLGRLSAADIVYSWGVLHHTGEMWTAIRNAARLMKTEGVFYLAIYQDRPYFNRPMEYWIDIKKKYNRVGWVGKRVIEFEYFWEFYLQKNIRLLPEFLEHRREYKKSRGMDMYTDAKDWLGGWPFEVATVEQIKTSAEETLGLRLVHLAANEANAEYLFRRL